VIQHSHCYLSAFWTIL